MGEGLDNGGPCAAVVVVGAVGIGVAGIVDWPVLVVGASAAWLLQRFRHPHDRAAHSPAPLTKIPITVPPD